MPMGRFDWCPIRDKDNNGEVDLIDGESFNKLLNKHQKSITDIDKNYIQKFDYKLKLNPKDSLAITNIEAHNVIGYLDNKASNA